MSYREEYLRYVKRELNDSFIKDGRTIEYKPHYHSFDEWFDDVWKENIKSLFTFIMKENKSEFDTITIKWNKETTEDWEMYCKYFNDNFNLETAWYNISQKELKQEWDGHFGILWRKSEFDKSKAEKMIPELKKAYYKFLKDNFKNWKLFDEFLRQDVVIWSEDYLNDKKKFDFMQEFIKKYGKSEKIIIDWGKLLEYLNNNMSNYIDKSHIKIIVIENNDDNFWWEHSLSDDLFLLKNKLRNWNIKVNYYNNQSIRNIVLIKK